MSTTAGSCAATTSLSIKTRLWHPQGVFLDLPAPWKAAASAVQCLMPNGVFISFSPCIEQVCLDILLLSNPNGKLQEEGSLACEAALAHLHPE